MATEGQADVCLPRVAIKFCVQCKWNLRAAYYAQELLSTFSNTIGEVALIPVTGGIFTITITLAQPTTQTDEASSSSTSTSTVKAEVVQERLLWDRKADGGFPETKELKNRVRNLIDPARDLGHVDRALKKSKPDQSVVPTTTTAAMTVGDREGASVPGDEEGGVSIEQGHQTHTGQEDCEECKQAQSEAVTGR